MNEGLYVSYVKTDNKSIKCMDIICITFHPLLPMLQLRVVLLAAVCRGQLGPAFFLQTKPEETVNNNNTG